jgi:hypothetical protein
VQTLGLALGRLSAQRVENGVIFVENHGGFMSFPPGAGQKKSPAGAGLVD